jgi:hypothetical protein
MSENSVLCRSAFVGQVANLQPIVNRPALWGSQSWLQPAFSRLSSPADKPKAPAHDLRPGQVRIAKSQAASHE